MELPPPLFLFIQTNKRCNLRCEHCDFWKLDDADRARYLGPARRRELLAEFAGMNPRGSVVICGGESMLDLEDYFHISRSCRELGLGCLSVINGTRVRDEATAERMIRESRDELELRVVERTRELEGANRTLAVEVEQRRDVEAALRESELRIRTILENSHDAFVACEEDGRVVEWNRAAEAVFGWRRSEVIGRSLGELIVPPALRYAHDNGADDVIFVGSDGGVLEAPTATVVAASGDTLVTAPLEGVLDGITVRRLFTAARTAGWQTDYRRLTPVDLAAADGVWLASSVRLLAPVTAIDGRERSDGALTAELARMLDVPGR